MRSGKAREIDQQKILPLGYLFVRLLLSEWFQSTWGNALLAPRLSSDGHLVLEVNLECHPLWAVTGWLGSTWSLTFAVNLVGSPRAETWYLQFLQWTCVAAFGQRSDGRIIGYASWGWVGYAALQGGLYHAQIFNKLQMWTKLKQWKHLG